jgi:hypothetical protein
MAPLAHIIFCCFEEIYKISLFAQFSPKFCLIKSLNSALLYMGIIVIEYKYQIYIDYF